MKRFIVSALILLTACTKNEHQPAHTSTIYYKNLEDFDVDYNHPLELDMNNDGIIDFAFAASASYDPLDNSVEKLEFRAYTLQGSLLFLNNVSPMVFNSTDKISLSNSETYSWTRNNALLATRVYTSSPVISYWEGAWKDKSNKFLGVKIKASDKLYTGWIRMSIGGNDSKITIHDYAFNTIAGVDIQAGAK